VLLASALPVVGAVLVIVEHPHSAKSLAPELVQSQLHIDVRTLEGKITHHGGKFIFREDRVGVIYNLDDQTEAKRFAGKSVLITGTEDSKANVVHVHKIEVS
jgi:hypothetical protein